MLPTAVTLVAPTGQTIVVGDAGVTYVEGQPVGYLLGGDTRLNPAPLVPRREDHPGITGGVVTPGRQDVREIELAGEIVGPDRTTVEKLKDDLAKCLSDHGSDNILVRWPVQGVVRELAATVDGAPEFSPDGWGGLFHVTLICADPIAYALTSKSVALGSSGNPSSATNGGNADVWPTVTVTVTGGTLEGLRVGNSTLGRYIDLGGMSYGAGTDIVIVMVPGREEIRAGSTNIYNKRNRVSSRPWHLRPGVNRLYATVTAGNASISAVADWRDGWVS